ncbi:MAG: hypothetical protein AB7I50_00725 [Vicinamibacterales bacterium]
MPQQLFSAGKIGLYLDDYGPGTEKRRDESVKIIKATFRLQPFDAKLATLVDDGLSDNSGVRAALFKLSSAEMKPHIERLNFNLSCPRQNMEIFASPDTDESRIALLQVKIGGVYARVQKDLDGFAFVFTGTFGPIDRNTLEYIHDWHGTQRFVTFEESEPSFEFSESDDEGADENAAPPPPPMFGDDEDEEPSEGEKVAQAKTFERTREKGHRYPKKSKAKAAKKGKQ